MPSPRELYAELEPERLPFERRAERCAALSIPYLFPRMGATSSDNFPTPFQSVAANGVNTMASAISLALFPPTVPFFRYEMDGEAEAELRALQAEFERAGGPERPHEEVQNSLGMRERSVVKELERRNYRVGVHEGIRHLLVVGNALLEHLDEGGLRLHPLRSYVVRRNPDSTVADLIVLEYKGADQLTEEEKAAVQSVDWSWPTVEKGERVPIYTHVRYRGARYEQIQQVGAAMLDDSFIEGDAVDCPWWPLRFIRTSNEHYGRSYVEEYYGDVATADILTQALAEHSALAAKVLFMVDPASGVSVKALSTAKNGAFRSGRADAVTTLQVGKHHDMAVAERVLDRTVAQVNRAFATPEVRQAERVTAEEIRFLQQQLERSLGGAFPLLALDLQLPMARQITKRLEARNALTPLPEGVVEPVIVTGIQALGRSVDSEKLIRYAMTAQQILGPAGAAQAIDQSVLLQRLATAEGIDSQGLIRTAQQIAAQAEASQQAQIQGKLAEKMVDAGGKVITKAMPEGSLAA